MVWLSTLLITSFPSETGQSPIWSGDVDNVDPDFDNTNGLDRFLLRRLQFRQPPTSLSRTTRNRSSHAAL
jgi:hypothetical protein